MSEPKRYQPVVQCVEPSYQAQMIEPKVMEFSEGEYVLHSDYARLKAEVERIGAENSHLHKGIYSLSLNVGQLKDEVERLTKAGDFMYDRLCWLDNSDNSINARLKWREAKGVQS